jgi:long-chain acyl-CoA synthetase
LYDYSEVIEAGKNNPDVTLTDPKGETIYMFCYTSGTTGDPKGAKLSHACFVSIAHILEYMALDFTMDDVSLSYLPLAHVYE